MLESLDIQNNPLLLPLLALSVLLVAWLLYRIFYRRYGGLERALADIGFDHIERLVIPNADEGEILIDHLVLTSQGLLIIEVKDVQALFSVVTSCRTGPSLRMIAVIRFPIRSQPCMTA